MSDDNKRGFSLATLFLFTSAAALVAAVAARAFRQMAALDAGQDAAGAGLMVAGAVFGGVAGIVIGVRSGRDFHAMLGVLLGPAAGTLAAMLVQTELDLRLVGVGSLGLIAFALSMRLLAHRAEP